MYTHPDSLAAARPPDPHRLRGCRAPGRLRPRRVDWRHFSGEPLYIACGYDPIERTIIASQDGIEFPACGWAKALG